MALFGKNWIRDPKNDDEVFNWSKRKRPSITSCCMRPNWIETNLGTYCIDCKQLTTRKTASGQDLINLKLNPESYED